MILYRLIKPIVDPVKAVRSIPRYISFMADLMRYSRMEGSEKVSFRDLYPCIHNRGAATGFDPHYVYQGVWAFGRIRSLGADYHVDVGSQVYFVTLLSSVIKVDFVDIRPLEIKAGNLNPIKGSVLEMPFEDGSLKSLSCLHVAEHVGLGRYGDPLDPNGTQKACGELKRVLAKGGDLYFSLPVGRPRTCFNAHRVSAPEEIIGYFSGLELVEFSGVDDSKNYREDISPSELEGAEYACGLFHFRKPE